ncbi:hypothetical protein COU59_02900 [Candidatus Pacearchaeota archaeon CG10_big_fil_rev_8_21_14_0_10_34_12]|nr:MAG: hypothetical protein COU59_02900 [Candidatus Pacearchaeota archaeon CG10_big_fil_rev_8_21_14_0_10_34_12]
MAKKSGDDLIDSFKKELDKIKVEGIKPSKKKKSEKVMQKSKPFNKTSSSKKIKAGKKVIVKKFSGKKKNIKIIPWAKVEKNEKTGKKYSKKDFPTLNIVSENDIAMDFATKVYQQFNKIVKSVVLFGSTAKVTNVSGSDIDIIIILDDASVKWDNELISWYREELEKIIMKNPYKKKLHINTIKLTTWFRDILRGDPVVINIIRDGEALIDFGGFFEPLKYLLFSGEIKSTPEAVYSLLDRAPKHIMRSKISELSSIEGLFWAMVDAAHAALISMRRSPPSPEKIPVELKETFVDKGKLKIKYVIWYRDLFLLHKKIAHGEISELRGVEIDEWQDRAEEFLRVMAQLVNDSIS